MKLNFPNFCFGEESKEKELIKPPAMKIDSNEMCWSKIPFGRIKYRKLFGREFVNTKDSLVLSFFLARQTQAIVVVFFFYLCIGLVT